MHVLVAGGAGFIGQHLIRALLERNARVTVLDPADVEADWRPQVQYLAHESLPEDFDLSNVDVVYLLASSSNIPATWDAPELEVRGNLLPTLALAQKAARAGVRRIAFASSGGTVYGNFEGLADEERAAQPYTPYGIIKFALEGFLQYLGRRFDVGVDVYRIANPYGPGQPVRRGQGVIAQWMDDIREKRPIRLIGSPQTTRDYVFVGDVAHRLCWSLREHADGGIWNIGTGQGTSLAALLEHLQALNGEKIHVETVGERAFDAPSNVLDGSRLNAHFPDRPYMPLAEGLAYTWRALQDGA